MKRSGVTTKIWLSIAVFVLGYAISITIEQIQNFFLEARLRNTANALFPAAQKAQEADEGLQRIIKAQSQAVLTEDSAALDQARQEGQKMVQDLRSMAALNGLANTRASEVASLATGLETWVQLSDRVYREAAASHGNMTDTLQANLHEVAKSGDAVKQRLAALVSSSAIDLRVELSSAADNTRSQRWIGLGLFFATLAIASFVVHLTINRAIRDPLARLTQALNDSTQQIGSASGSLSGSSETLSRSASSQASALEQTAAAAEQVSTMSRRNSEGAGEARKLMHSATTISQEVDSAHGQLVSAMAEIGQSSTRISKIIRVIEEIAFQTNILALNAAVEAARAGQAGMGFTVVAEEVRNLAHRCSQAAKDTSELIEDSVTRSSAGRERLDAVTILLRRNRDIAVQVDQLIAQISTASQEQVSGIEQISRNLATTSHDTQTTAAHAERSAGTVNELAQQAENLALVVESLEAMIAA